MARCPFAQWRPLGPQQEPRLRRKNIAVLHTMVGSLGSVDSYFRDKGYSGVESHFGVGHDGTIYQWQDTTHQADAQAEGNDNCVSIETADSGPGFPNWSGSNVPAWTDAQLDAIVKLVRWLCDEHDIPDRLVPDSGANRRGIGYHRQGVDPWREAGAEEWSDAYGKVCPGDRRIHQIKTAVIPRVQGEDMPITDADAEKIVRTLLHHREPPFGDDDGADDGMRELLHFWRRADERSRVAAARAEEDRVTRDAPERREVRQVLAAVKALGDQLGAPVDVDEQAIVKGVLAGMAEANDPAATARLFIEALPEEFAKQVVLQLGQQLSQNQ